MGVTEERARRLVDQLAQELSARSGAITRHTDYYKGKHPLRFASNEFRQYFAKQYAGFSDNWVGPVADSPVERLTVTGIKLDGETTADKDLWRVWQRNSLDADSQLGFLGSGLGARSFALVWGDPPEVTFEDARQVVVAYAPGSRRTRTAALKQWQDGSREFATLYLADEVWKFDRAVSGPEPQKSAQMKAVDDLLADDDRGWRLRQTGDEPNPQPNPMGKVPVVELPNRPLLADDPISDVSGVVAMQDAINLLWSQLFTASDAASFPQRVISGSEVPKTPILDENGQKIGERPVPLEKFAVDRVLWLTNPNTKISHWPAANLAAYTEVIEVAVGHIAAQTRTPQHYLIGKMANLSGDALIAAETGLVKKCEEKQLWFGAGLREVFELIALAQGDERKADAVMGGTVLWRDAESRNIAQLTDSLLKLKQIGFPFEWLAARYGLSPTEVADVVAMRESVMDRVLDGDFAAVMSGPKPQPGGNNQGDEDPADDDTDA